ncbi:hypothetical protein I6J22_08210 [Corynebacterium kroppenstedtii]|uniref:Uncharacterized protein n=1 Tax=Corynebacterium kroppenstedtii (strain DSM 44385 / JCM 11950 / CIP 105744 / CCUG 35717) TaxID=645127 RepID=C4LKY2_CORK4|nr:hypothetical protein [Corynebacterium kroppenstedtii]ACR18487.1 hypothetical protein ckrop_1766 [Corynebacterium kroppenstedtii DSM 44385]QRP10183.1 hypothetical protein I6J22_08210 [Corynebacterium kroppenstedtii]
MGDFFVVIACVGPIFIGLFWRWPWGLTTGSTRAGYGTSNAAGQSSAIIELYPLTHAYSAPVMLAVLHRVVRCPITLSSTAHTGADVIACWDHSSAQSTTTWRLCVELPTADSSQVISYIRSCGWQAWVSPDAGQEPGWDGYLRDVRALAEDGQNSSDNQPLHSPASVATGSAVLPDSSGRIAIISSNAEQASDRSLQCRAARHLAERVRAAGRRVTVITDSPGEWVSTKFTIVVPPDGEATSDSQGGECDRNSIFDAAPRQSSALKNAFHPQRDADLEIWDCSDASITWAITHGLAETIIDIVRRPDSQRWREAHTVMDASDLLRLIERPDTPSLLRTGS